MRWMNSSLRELVHILAALAVEEFDVSEGAVGAPLSLEKQGKSTPFEADPAKASDRACRHASRDIHF